MIYLSDLQKETLLKIDDMIEKNKTFEEIEDWLYKNDYIFSIKVKKGYKSKTKFTIEKIIRDKEKQTIKFESTFVSLIKRRNGLAYWETIKIY